MTLVPSDISKLTRPCIYKYIWSGQGIPVWRRLGPDGIAAP